MSWFNFHTHSDHCDGKSTLQQITEHAKKLNLAKLGFSSHAPLPFDCKWCMKSDKLQRYIDEINQIKNSSDIEVYAGLEVDYIPHLIGPKDFESKLDYTIGSVHFVEKFENGIGWEIDGTHAFFLEGLNKIFKNDFKAAVARYFELTREMVLHSTPSVVGHIDKIKMQNINNKLFDENESWYRNEIEKTLDAIKKTGVIIEINTRGIYQRKTSTTYPSPWILERIKEKNIPITMSSDAHLHEDLINQFPETSVLLKQIGFKEIVALDHDNWLPFKFNEKGLIQ